MYCDNFYAPIAGQKKAAACTTSVALCLFFRNHPEDAWLKVFAVTGQGTSLIKVVDHWTWCAKPLTIRICANAVESQRLSDVILALAARQMSPRFLSVTVCCIFG